jgi:hypothetical protein
VSCPPTHADLGSDFIDAAEPGAWRETKRSVIIRAGPQYGTDSPDAAGTPDLRPVLGATWRPIATDLEQSTTALGVYL